MLKKMTVKVPVALKLVVKVQLTGNWFSLTQMLIKQN